VKTVDAGNAEHYCWGEGCEGSHLVRTAELSVIQERVPPRAREVRHLHERAQQFFFVLEGEATLTIHEQVVVLRASQGCFVPAGVPHELRNDAGEDLVFILVSAPPSHGDRIAC